MEVVRRILDLTGASPDLVRHVEDRPGHDRRYAVDSSKLRGLGWAPAHSFDAGGLEETVEWYRENREWWEPIKSGEYRRYYEHAVRRPACRSDAGLALRGAKLWKRSRKGRKSSATVTRVGRFAVVARLGLCACAGRPRLGAPRRRRSPTAVTPTTTATDHGRARRRPCS